MHICRAFIAICFMTVAMIASARVPAALQGKWIVERLGPSTALHLAEFPYEVELGDKFEETLIDGKALSTVSVDIRTAAEDGECWFSVRGSTLVAPKELQTGDPRQVFPLCTAMEGSLAALMDRPICEDKPDPKKCEQTSYEESRFVSDFLLSSDSLVWRRKGDRLFLYCPAHDTEIVLRPNPLM